MVLSTLPPRWQSSLEEVRTCLIQGREARKASYLEAGKLLHDYVRSWLAEGDAMPWNERQRLKKTRRQAIFLAADYLGQKRIFLCQLIMTAQAVRLLAPAGATGSFCWGTLLAFGRFLKRGTDSQKHPGRDQPGIRTETWQIRPGWEEKARELYREALEDSWPHEETCARIRELLGKKKRPRRRRTPREASAIHVLKKAATRAAPGDVAQVCWEILQMAEDPAAVWHKLEGIYKEKVHAPSPR